MALVDLGLPDSFRVETIRRIQERVPDLAVIAFTGLDDEAMAVEALAAGAQDYLVKGQQDLGLMMRAVRYAIERKRLENAHVQLNRELTNALAEIRALNSTLPLCVNCKSVRNDGGYWERIEEYIRARTRSAVSHVLCPAYAQGLYGDYVVDLPS